MLERLQMCQRLAICVSRLELDACGLTYLNGWDRVRLLVAHGTYLQVKLFLQVTCQVNFNVMPKSDLTIFKSRQTRKAIQAIAFVCIVMENSVDPECRTVNTFRQFVLDVI